MRSKWAAFFLALAACLPELSALPADTSDAAPPPPPSPCGNGVIDTDAETCDPGAVDGGSPGCESCNVVCEGVLDPVTKHCYFAVEPATSLNDARDKCRTRAAHIATIGSLAELAEIDASSPYWSGVAFDVNAYAALTGLGLEPGWPEPDAGTGPCPGCFGLGLDGGGVDGKRSACVVTENGVWKGVDCTGTSYATICEREPRGRRYQPCNGGLCFSLPETTALKSYLVVLAPTTSTAAQATCSAFQGQLLVVESPEERAAVTRELLLMSPLEDVTSTDFWIGLHLVDQAWKWEGSRPGLEAPWGDKEPRAGTDAFLKVTAFYDTSLAHAGNASDTKYFVCQLPR